MEDIIKKKRLLVPLVNISHDDTDTGLWIEIDLAGASKESVVFDMGTNGFCVKAEGEELKYDNCYMLAHEILPEKSWGKFNSGLLKVYAPFKETTHGYQVPIE